MIEFLKTPYVRILMMNLGMLLLTALGCFLAGYLVRDVELRPTRLTAYKPWQRLVFKLLVTALALKLLLMLISTPLPV